MERWQNSYQTRQKFLIMDICVFLELGNFCVTKIFRKVALLIVLCQACSTYAGAKLNCYKSVLWSLSWQHGNSQMPYAGLPQSYLLPSHREYKISCKLCYLASEGGLGAFPCSGDGDLTGEGDLRNIGDVAAKKTQSKWSVSNFKNLTSAFRQFKKKIKPVLKRTDNNFEG